jgi:hypothetical protein
MSNDPRAQKVIPDQKHNQAFPTSTKSTVVGPVKVAEKSYDIQGKVVDSSHDTPLDVNAMHHVTGPAQGTLTMLEGDHGKTGAHAATGQQHPVQQHPNQSFVGGREEH